jgi:P-type Ca2+ transporter type 2C
MQSVLTAVQLLWVNLIMDTFAALALATDPPTEKILDRPPQPKSAPLITIRMWKMIIGQAIFQLAVTLVLYYAGAQIFGFDQDDSHHALQLDTMVFNTFVWMQIWNEFNNRRLDNRFNILEGAAHNYYFWLITLVMVGGQVVIVCFGGTAFSITPLTVPQHFICIGVAAFCLPWAVLIRLFSDEWYRQIATTLAKPLVIVYEACSKVSSRIRRVFKRSQKPQDSEESTPEQENYNAPTIFVSEPAVPTIHFENQDLERGHP